MAMNPQPVHGAGLILYRKGINDAIQFLILKSRWGRHWSFPKGHLDTGETELVCALRETREETGIDQEKIQLVGDKRALVQYKLPRKTKNVSSGVKCVAFFLARVRRDTDVNLGDEHCAYRWAARTEAIRLLRPEMGNLIDPSIRTILDNDP